MDLTVAPVIAPRLVAMLATFVGLLLLQRSGNGRNDLVLVPYFCVIAARDALAALLPLPGAVAVGDLLALATLAFWMPGGGGYAAAFGLLASTGAAAMAAGYGPLAAAIPLASLGGVLVTGDRLRRLAPAGSRGPYLAHRLPLLAPLIVPNLGQLVAGTDNAVLLLLAWPLATLFAGLGIARLGRELRDRELLENALLRDEKLWFLSYLAAGPDAQPLNMERSATWRALPTDQTPFADLIRSDAPQTARHAGEKLIAAPLRVGTRTLGVLALALGHDAALTSTDAALIRLGVLARYAAVSIDGSFARSAAAEQARIRVHLAIASGLRGRLAPPPAARMRSATLLVLSRPAPDVGGDLGDIMRLDDRKTAVAVGDIAGKGLPAVLVLIVIRSILRLVASAGRSPAQTLTWLNRGIRGTVNIDRYASLGFAIYDDASRRLAYASAANPPPLLYRAATESIEEVSADGIPIPIGVDRTTLYRDREITLGVGDVFVMYTDGVTEAMDERGEQYSWATLATQIRANAHRSAREILDALWADLDVHARGALMRDDQTIAVLKVAERKGG